MRPLLMGMVTALIVGTTVLPTASLAQTTAVPTVPTPPEARLDDIVVDSSPIEDLARRFVETASAPPSYRGLARWHSEMCLGVVGLRADVAVQISDRVSAVAEGLSVPLGAPGCEPNAVIIATDDAAELAGLLVDERRRAFRIGFTRSNRGSAALRTFQTSDEAVRWWHISFPYEVGSDCLAIKIFQGPRPCANSFDLTFRSVQVEDRIRRAIVILDMTKLEGMPLSALSDLTAMVVLAQIDPDGDTTQFDTILNLLESNAGVTSLTTWDKAYLDALYGAQPGRLNRVMQADAMASGLVRDQRTASDTGPD